MSNANVMINSSSYWRHADKRAGFSRCGSSQSETDKNVMAITATAASFLLWRGAAGCPQRSGTMRTMGILAWR